MNNNIKFYRKKKGISQEELAARSGVSRTTLSYLETGKQKDITNSTMHNIADALGYSVYTIFFKERV